VILYLTYWFPSHRRAKMIAVFMSGIPVAGILGNPLSGWIMDAFHNTHGLDGWQWMFLIEAIPALLIGLATVLYLDNDVKSAKWLSDEEKKVLQPTSTAMPRARKASTVWAPCSSDSRVWWMCLIYFSFVMGQYGLTFWMPTLVKATGVTGNLHIGLLSAIPFLCAIVAMNLIGRSADRARAPLAPDRAGHDGCGLCGAALFADNTVARSLRCRWPPPAC
jgi:MFS family permease